MCRRLAREEGVLVGISSGANVVASRMIGERLASAGKSGVIVTILCDGAGKYLSESFWNDPD
jgi:S-sulfo-L-cysteine synthase (O-acetyl-L-serine-dependent)